MTGTTENAAHSEPQLSRAEEILRAREARVLVWSLAARLVSFTIAGSLSLLHLLRVLPPGGGAEADSDAYGVLALAISMGAAVWYGLTLARRRAWLTQVGLGAVVVDTVFLAALPVLWWYGSPAGHSSPGFLIKGELLGIGLVMIVINSMPLRSLYAALMTLSVFGIHGAATLFVLARPDVAIASGYLEHGTTAAVSPGVLTVRMIILLLIGSALTVLTKAARRTIHDAVDLEVANFEIKERQTEMIMEGKMSAVRSLVAGVAHEMNSPAGVIRSSVGVVEKCAHRLNEQVGSSDRNGARVSQMLRLLTESATSARQALERISGLVRSLRDFAQLDEAERQPANLNKSLDGALALVPSATRGSVEVIREYDDIPEIVCRPQELNQVFYTLLKNAFEAMAGDGTLLLRTRIEGRHVRVEVGDSGPGIPREKLASLFELGFSSEKGRVTMGMGLPVAQRIVDRHGGSLAASSRLGDGTTFTISLPVRATELLRAIR